MEAIAVNRKKQKKLNTHVKNIKKQLQVRTHCREKVVIYMNSLRQGCGDSVGPRHNTEQSTGLVMNIGVSEPSDVEKYIML